MTTLRVTTRDSHVFVGPTAEAVVRQMRDTQWNAPERKRQWMDEVADRLYQSHGIAIPVGASADEFLTTLADADIIAVARVP